MISALILVPTLFTPAPCTAPRPAPTPVQADAAYEERRTSAGEDPEKLWELALWCESTERDREARSVLRKLLKLESLVETIRQGQDPRSAFQALAKAIAKADDELLEFAGL